MCQSVFQNSVPGRIAGLFIPWDLLNDIYPNIANIHGEVLD